MMKGEHNYTIRAGVKQAIADKAKRLMWTVNWRHKDGTWSGSGVYFESEEAAIAWAKIRCGADKDSYLVSATEK